MRRMLLAGFCSLLAFSPALAETQSFQQALALAYSNNPALLADRAKLRAIDEQIAEAQSGWRPMIDAGLSAGVSRQDPPMMATGQKTLEPRSGALQLKQNLFSGFKTVAGVRAAKAQVAAQQALLQNAEQQLLLSAGQSYLDVVRDQAVVDLTRGNEDVLRKQLEATRDRFAVGEVTQTDVSQAESRLQRASAGRIQAEGGLAADRAAFMRLVGVMPESLTQPDLDLSGPKEQDEVIARAEKNHPLVRAAQSAEDAAREQVTVAEAALLPEINVIGSASRGWDQSVLVTERQDTSQIMAQVTIPLYRGGADYARTRAAKQTVTQNKMQLLDAKNRAREAAISAWQALATSRAALAANRAQIEAADLAHQGVREESKVGTRTTLDVLNAEQELLDARVSLVKSEREQAAALLQNLAAMGDLTPEHLNLQIKSYDPKAHASATSGKWIGFGED